MRDDRLSLVLSEFARTLVTDFPIQGILDHLVHRIVAVLSVTGAGVTLISPGVAPQYVAASDDAALRHERLQTELGEGPCLLAYESGEAVLVPDLDADGRFPAFGPRAVADGMAAVFTFPLRHGEGRLGALDLYRDTAGPLPEDEMVAAQTLADVASAYLLNARAREEAQEVSDRFRHSALHDALTGLPNRALLQQRLEHAAQRAQRSHATAAVLFADLDRFKRVNDTYGHDVGDALLASVAQRLTSVVRPGDTLARVSGDEFVVLCEDLSEPGDVDAVAARIVEVLARPFTVRGTTLVLSASVGIAYCGPGEAVTQQLVSDADTAMYEAKRRGGGRTQVIDLRAAQQARERNHLEHDLRAALRGPGIDLAYQPIVSTADGRVVGVEALLRWTHPTRDVVAPLTTVSIAEQSGLIAELGSWVLRRACHDRARWLVEQPLTPLDLSVNVSVRELMAPGFRAGVAAALEATGTDPGALVLEVTEGIFIEDGDRALTVLADLKELGVRVALDDFGTGYCSLGYLRRFPVDHVKIDQGFVADIGVDPAGTAIVAAINDLAHALGLTVTAEGVETEQQRTEIVRMGCESAQGFLYARPMSDLEVSARLSAGPVLLP